MSTPNTHLANRQTSATTSRTPKQSASMLLGQLRRHGDTDNTATHGLPPSVVFTMLRYLTFEERVFLAMCSHLALVLLPYASYFERPVGCPSDGLYVGTGGSSWKGNTVFLVSTIFRTIIGRHSPVHELQLSLQLEPQHVLLLAKALGGQPSVTTNLRTLVLRECGLTCDGARAVAQAIPPSLTTLNMQSNHIGNAGAQYLARMLKDNTALNIANLAQNDIGMPDGWSVENRGFRYQQYKHTDGRTQGERPQGTRSAVLALAESLRINRALTSINLLRNDLADGATAIVAAAKQNGNIKTLCGIEEGKTEVNLADKYLRAPDAVLLSFDLEFNRALTSLDLSRNEIGAGGAKAIAGTIVQSALKRLAINMVLNIEDLKSSASIDLSGKGLRTEEAIIVAKCMEFNRSLKSANLAVNDIGDEGAIAISAAVESNTTLTDLNLQARRHSNYGTNIVKISATGAQAIAKMLAVNRALKSANLGLNSIGDEGTAALCEALKSNSTLEELELYTNEIGAAGAQSLANMLQFNRALKKLVLTDNKIGSAGASALSDGLKTNNTLVELLLDGRRLWGNIGPGGAKSIAAMLTVNRALTSVNLLKNNLGDGAAAVVAAAKQNGNIKTLCGIEEGKTEASFSGWGLEAPDAVLLRFDLEFNRALKSVNLGCNGIRDESTTALSEALKSNSTLEELELWSNRISVAGAQSLASMLQSNRALTSLGLSENSIVVSRGGGWTSSHPNAYATYVHTDGRETVERPDGVDFEADLSGIQALAGALKVNRALKKLKLDRNNIQVEGTAALSEALKSNNTLETLELRANEIGVAGAQSLADMLQVNRALKSAHLGQNDIGDEGAIAISTALENNDTLTEIDLNGYECTVKIGPAGAQAIAKMLAVNRALTTLNLLDNDIGTPDGWSIELDDYGDVKHYKHTNGRTQEERPQGTSSGVVALAGSLKVSRALKFVDLRYNSIPDEGCRQLRAAVGNRSITLQLEPQQD